MRPDRRQQPQIKCSISCVWCTLSPVSQADLPAKAIHSEGLARNHTVSPFGECGTLFSPMCSAPNFQAYSRMHTESPRFFLYFFCPWLLVSEGSGQCGWWWQKTVSQVGVFSALYRGACSNNLLERQIWLEQRLLADLQAEILKPQALEYTITQFGEQLKATLGKLSGELAQMRECKKTIESELRRLTETAALTGPSTFLIQAINVSKGCGRSLTDCCPPDQNRLTPPYGNTAVRHQEAFRH